MTVELCRGLPAEWFDSTDDGARLALAVCRRCPAQATCLGGDDKPIGVIRGGVAFDDGGRPFDLCLSCGYPRTALGSTPAEQCYRCVAPSVYRWRGDIMRWLDQGLTTRQAGARIGATSRQVKDIRARMRLAGAAA